MPGFDNLKRPRSLDRQSLPISFCHAKATWYPEPARLFSDCYVALETGILPKSGGLSDQDSDFANVFYFFVDYYKRKYNAKQWYDISELVKICLESLAKMFGKMFGGK